MTQSYSESQLSQDLQVFLANPSLRAALADGSLDLASYSGQVERELQHLEQQCIAVYRHKAADIHTLRRELRECQTVLAALQEMLLGFQADLGGLSGDIRQLQYKSRQLDIQLRNRRGASTELHGFLQHLVLSPHLVNVITTGTVNPLFLKCVQEVNQMYHDSLLTTPQPWTCPGVAPCDTVAGQEMQRHLHQLRLLAVTRVRDYFLQQLALLRRSQTNIRMIQVHGLLKYAPLMDFLTEAAPAEMAHEIWNVYVESMSKTMLLLFRTYQAQLLQLDATKLAATRQDVIAMEDALLRDSLTTRAKKRVDVFCLGRRAQDCLQVQQQPPILAHVALAEQKKYPYEALFRSLLGHLVDAVTNEHVFCRQFFKRDAFQPLFHNTLSLLLEQLENYLFQCYDALCLLLMIKVTHSYRRLARQRKISSLDPFLDHVTKLLWPRLKTVMDGHLRSIKQATAPKLGGVDLHPHYVSRRFAEFTSSILQILHDKTTTTTSTKGGGTPTASSRTPSRSHTTPATSPIKTPPTRTLSGDDGGSVKSTLSTLSSSPVPHSHSGVNSSGIVTKTAGDKLLEDLSEMIDEYLLLLERLADEHNPQQKKRIVFLINNLDQVVSIFQERRVTGKEYTSFVELLMRQRELFVEEELLSTGFSKMIAFIQQTEAHIASTSAKTNTSGPAYDINSQVVETLVIDFASNWKQHMEQINRNVLSYFSNFRNGMEILKQVLTQLLLYYTRFHDIIRKVWRNKPPAFCKDLVSTNVILNEIKKYALAI